jgi:hypothetical protein
MRVVKETATSDFAPLLGRADPEGPVVDEDRDVEAVTESELSRPDDAGLKLAKGMVEDDIGTPAAIEDDSVKTGVIAMDVELTAGTVAETVLVRGIVIGIRIVEGLRVSLEVLTTVGVMTFDDVADPLVDEEVPHATRIGGGGPDGLWILTLIVKWGLVLPLSPNTV